jgi:putative addiction module component (TIGR02574 family)
MSVSLESLGIDGLTVDERLALVEDLWDSIAEETAATALTNAQRIKASITTRLS